VLHVTLRPLAARFKRRVGETPIDYLTPWRMFRASCLLRQSQHAVGDIAEQVGHESEAAFSKAFERVMGSAPGAHQRTQGALGAMGIRSPTLRPHSRQCLVTVRVAFVSIH
jgi:transcriptional regulator GlxA family with amidase domain